MTRVFKDEAEILNLFTAMFSLVMSPYLYNIVVYHIPRFFTVCKDFEVSRAAVKFYP